MTPLVLSGFLIGLTYLGFHILSDNDESDSAECPTLPPMMTTIPAALTSNGPPVIHAVELNDSVAFVIPKSSLPEEDTLNRTYSNIPTINHTDLKDTIPLSFDAREKWPDCSGIIGKVWDQGSCQACWAVSAASVMTDRICIKSGAASKVVLSPQHLICSCKNCTSRNNVPSMAMCMGGDSEAAWEFWVQEGLVSGGDYRSKDNCLPYLSKPCIHSPGTPPAGDLVQCSLFAPDAYVCPQSCADSSRSLAQEKKYKGSKIYYVQNKAEDIQREIMLNGPVQAKFVFNDILLQEYSKDSGLFSCPADQKSSHVHSVKIIGWNETDSKEPYWLCVNSYGTRWGDGGLMKIKRGENMCRIEESVMAGDPTPTAA